MDEEHQFRGSDWRVLPSQTSCQMKHLEHHLES